MIFFITPDFYEDFSKEQGKQHIKPKMDIIPEEFKSVYLKAVDAVNKEYCTNSKYDEISAIRMLIRSIERMEELCLTKTPKYFLFDEARIMEKILGEIPKSR